MRLVTWSLVAREDADERAIDDEAGPLERVAGRALRRDALGLGSDQSLRPGKVRLPEPVGHRNRVIPLQQVDVPHRAVVELTSDVGPVLEDVDRRLLIQDGGIQTLALDVVLTSLAVDERAQALASAPRVDERSAGGYMVRATVGQTSDSANRR